MFKDTIDLNILLKAKMKTFVAAEIIVKGQIEKLELLE
jgi:hypothetical protein